MASSKLPEGELAFNYFPDNYRWSHGLLIALGGVPWGGGEIDEINRIGLRLKHRVGDDAAWFAEWTGEAERTWTPSGRRLPPLPGGQRQHRHRLHVGPGRQGAPGPRMTTFRRQPLRVDGGRKYALCLFQVLEAWIFGCWMFVPGLGIAHQSGKSRYSRSICKERALWQPVR
jgi:hypothetical protein